MTTNTLDKVSLSTIAFDALRRCVITKETHNTIMCLLAKDDLAAAAHFMRMLGLI